MGLAIFVAGIVSPLLFNFLLLVAAPTTAVFLATLFSLPPINWLLVAAMFAEVDAPGGMAMYLVVLEAASGWLFGAIARTSIAFDHGRRPMTQSATLLLYTAAVALLFLYPGPPAVAEIAFKATEVSFVLLVVSLIFGYFPMQLLPTRRAALVIAGVVIVALAVGWTAMLRASLTFDGIWIVGLVVLASEFGYGVVTGALVRCVLPPPVGMRQLWVRATLAFVPLALIGVGLFALLRDRL